MGYTEARRSFTRVAAAATALLVALAACEDGVQMPAAPDGQADPGIRAVQQDGAQGEAPFYYYDGRKIFLETVPGKFVVKARAGVDPVSAAREALDGKGLDVRQSRAWPEGHREVEVLGAAAAQSEELAALLRKHRGLSFASATYRTTSGAKNLKPLDRMAVMFEDGASASEIQELSQQFGTTIERQPVLENGWRYHVLSYPASGDRSPLEIANAFEEHPLVQWVAMDRAADLAPAGGAAEPFFGEQWYLDDNSQTGPNGVPVDINVRDAWDNSTGDSTVRVVVLDTGIDGGHGELDDLVEGGDATEELDGLALEPGDELGDSHGTSVAGIIAANHDGVGVAGIAPDVTIVAMQILSEDSDDATTLETADFINKAWSTLDGDVLNNSWGYSSGRPTDDDEVEKAIQWATKDGRGGKGSVVVFAAGNDGGAVDFPAEVPEAIAVSAIEKSGAIASYSNTGPEIEIGAPSSSNLGLCKGNIVTLDLAGPEGCSDGPGGDVDTTDGFGGTSAAAPQVSAAAALLITNNPSLTESEVRQLLKDAADPWGDSDLFGAGKLNVGNLFYDGTSTDGGGDDCTGTSLECTQ